MSATTGRLFPGAAQVLRDDSARAFRFWSVVTGVLLVAWGVWFVVSHVPLYVGSETARMEATEVHWIEAPVAGQIRAVRAALGDHVQPGDVIVELDASAEQLRETEESLQRGSAVSRAGLLRSQLDATQLALKKTQDVAAASVAESRARSEEAHEKAHYAASAAARAGALFRQGLVSESLRDEAASEAARTNAAAATQDAVMRRVEAESRVGLASRQGDVDHLRAEISIAEAAIGTSAVASEILKHDTDLRVIRAGIAGKIASDLPKRRGAFVDEGERLTSIVPSGHVTIIGYFRPEVAIGRVRSGQKARFRVDAYPPGEYGWIEGRVLEAATEPRDGKVRVEVAITRRNPSIPMEHGLTGSLEIETESVTPMVLVLRAVGRRS
jgi:membrane fusion protein (multidrug efflux system)